MDYSGNWTQSNLKYSNVLINAIFQLGVNKICTIKPGGSITGMVCICTKFELNNILNLNSMLTANFKNFQGNVLVQGNVILGLQIFTSVEKRNIAVYIDISKYSDYIDAAINRLNKKHTDSKKF